MEYLEALNSGSSPKIEKAARQIFKKKLEGYCPHLIEVLEAQIKKPKAWKSQSELIKAIGATGCSQALPLLKNLVEKDFKATVLYKHLAFSIMLLQNASMTNIEFLYASIKKGNSLQIGGACSALLYNKVIPNNDDIKNILIGIEPFTENEGKVIGPRVYIAALAYLWPKEQTKDFLENCLSSDSTILAEIAQSSLQGKEPYYKLV